MKNNLPIFNSIDKNDYHESLTLLFQKAKKHLILQESDFYLIMDLLDFAKKDKVLLGVLLIALISALNEGSLCLSLDQGIDNKLSCFLEQPDEIKAHILKKIEDFKSLIAVDENDYKPLIIYQYKERRFLYFRKYYIFERELKKEIDKRIKQSSQLNLDHEIIMQIKNSRHLNSKQKIATYLAVINKFLIISGGPGTGKTTIIREILILLIKMGIKAEQIVLAAPTGRASKKMVESIHSHFESISSQIQDELRKIEGKTIHRLLRYQLKSDTFYYNQNNQLNFNTIIVDEVSMLDFILMTHLLKAIPENTRLIILGDKDQLPSVEAGAILAELIPDESFENYSQKTLATFPGLSKKNTNFLHTDKIVILNQNYRSVKDILDIAASINQKKLDVIDQIPGLMLNKFSIDQLIENKKNCFFISPVKDELNSLKTLLKRWSNHYFTKNNDLIQCLDSLLNITFQQAIDEKLIDLIFMLINSSKILTVLKEKINGANWINEYIKNYIIINTKSKLKIGNYYSGLPILIKENDYSLKLFNGDIGILLKDKNSTQVLFQTNNQYFSYPIEILPDFEIAYAITVHKSQGSEFDDVCIILPNELGCPLNTKEILYTGLTRSRNKAVIFAKKEILIESINHSITRESGISLWH